MKGAAMHRAFLLFKKSGEVAPPPVSVAKKSGFAVLFRQKLKKCLCRGAQTPRPPGKAGRYDFILAGLRALQTSPNGFLTVCAEA